MPGDAGLSAFDRPGRDRLGHPSRADGPGLAHPDPKTNFRKFVVVSKSAGQFRKLDR